MECMVAAARELKPEPLRRVRTFSDSPWLGPSRRGTVITVTFPRSTACRVVHEPHTKAGTFYGRIPKVGVRSDGGPALAVGLPSSSEGGPALTMGMIARRVAWSKSVTLAPAPWLAEPAVTARPGRNPRSRFAAYPVTLAVEAHAGPAVEQ